jgi:hypothetical protein
MKNQGRVWTECKGEYLPPGAGKVLDVSEGSRGEDRLTFRCEHCGQVHTNAMAWSRRAGGWRRKRGT